MKAALLIIRLVVALGLAAHGSQKLFGWFGGGGLDGTAAAMDHMGFRPGRANGLAAGVSEVAGGLLLALGLFTPLAAAMIIGVMVNAGIVHSANGYFLVKDGYEYTLTLAAIAVGLVAGAARAATRQPQPVPTA
jgi:putative oxidoreductase